MPLRDRSAFYHDLGSGLGAALFAALLALGLAAGTPARAGERADEPALQAVERFLYEQTQNQGAEVIIEVHPPSVELPPCPSPEPFLPRPSGSLSGRVSVGVRCGGDGRQVRYLQAEIDVYGRYPVLKQPLSAGSQVIPDMLRSEHGNLSRLPRDAVREPESVIGQVARRNLAAGVPLQHRQFETKPLVERGDQVVVEARGSNFRVTREGTALDPGGAGDLVRVRFPDRELVRARVVDEARLVIEY
ncbi:MAG: flagellar basal body P-ring formation protein FlgA [Gammaproteobacteria bacterium]|jgi:flagella basal body P-ring formation protein FlgA|nr:flagellar basal body P-ring formation protein FlgA [Gammaproteobacteria bacterium]